MTLEVLFAREAQGEAFLLLMCVGVLLAGMVHLAGALHRHASWLGMAADVLCGAAMAAALLGIALRTGAELRLYALLGLLIGAALYASGVKPLVQCFARTIENLRKKLFPAGRKGHSPCRNYSDETKGKAGACDGS